MEFKRLVFISSVLIYQFGFSQDFKTSKDLRNLMNLNVAQIEDSLINKGFQFEKSEGNIFCYTKNTSKIELRVNPREITYSSLERAYYLTFYAELQEESFVFKTEQTEIQVKNSIVKADLLAKDNEHIYLWNTPDEVSKKILYTIKIQGNTSNSNNEKKQDNKSKSADQIFDQMTNAFFKVPVKTVPKKELKQDSIRHGLPKLFRFNISIGAFDFRDPGYPDDGFNLYPNYQIGFQKSRFIKFKPQKKWLSDAGMKMDLGYMPGLTYGPSDKSWYVNMWKIFLVYNQYTSIDLKLFNLVLQGGVYLNYNYGTGSSFNGTSDISAGFLAKGFHFGEQIQRGIEKSKYGYPKKLIGIGFDQYVDITGSYIGSFGIYLGF